MRKIVFGLMLIVAIVVGVGFYRGWFGLTTQGEGGEHRVTLKVDEDKIKADTKRAQEQLPSMRRTEAPPTKTPESEHH